MIINGQEVQLGTSMELVASQWVTNVNDIYYTSGNIGIQKTNPAYSLDVSGSINCSQLLVNGSEPSFGGGGGGGEGSIFVIHDDDFSESLPDYKTGINNSITENIGWVQDLTNNLTYVSGNVGIGIVEPSYNLDVSGTVNCLELLVDGVAPLFGSGGGDNILLDASYTTGSESLVDPPETQRFDTNKFWVLDENDNISFTLNSGNVGIGTTSPTALLHLQSTEGVTLMLEADSDNTNEDDLPLIHMKQDQQLVFHTIGGTNQNDFKFETGTTNGDNTNYMAFFTGGGSGPNSGTERLRISGDGNVGIGTTSPQTKLHINSGILFAEDTTNTNRLILYATGNGGGQSNNHYEANQYSEFGSAIFIKDTGATGSTITLVNKESGLNTEKHASIGFVNTDGASAGKFGGQIGFWPEGIHATQQQFRIYTSGASAGYNLPVQQMVVTGDGNVGIGTDTPSHTLDISGNARMNQLIIGDELDSTGNVSLVIKDNGTGNGHGNVTSAGGIRIVSTAAQQSGSVDLLMGVNHASKYSFLQSTEYAIAHQNLILQPVGGNVGIGTTSPASKLHIHETTGTLASGTKGTITLSNGSADGTNGGNSIVFLSNDNPISDYAYIEYQSRFNDVNESGLLTIGCLNDGGGKDNIAIMAGGGGGVKGYVGIGTTTPSELLTVQSAPDTDATFSVTTQDEHQDAILYLGTPNTPGDAKKCAIIAEGLTNWSRSDLHFCLNPSVNDNNTATANATLADSKMVIQNDGKVGIGTTTPTHALDVNGALKLQSIPGNVSQGYEAIRFARNDNDIRYSSIYASAYHVSFNVHDSGPLPHTGEIEVMRLTTDRLTSPSTKGRVGIGTTDPIYTLDVSGEISSSEHLVKNGTYTVKHHRSDNITVYPNLFERTTYDAETVLSNKDTFIYIKFSSSDKLFTHTIQPYPNQESDYLEFRLNDLDGNRPTDTDFDGQHSLVTMTTYSQYTNTDGDFTTRNIKIQKDYVIGDSTTTQFTPQLSIASGSADGNVVGIGLNVSGSGYTHRTLTTGSLYYKKTTGSNWGIVGYLGLAVTDPAANADDKYGITDGELEAQTHLAITNNGNVGIGTTVPSAKLHVNGNIELGTSSESKIKNTFGNLTVEAEHGISLVMDNNGNNPTTAYVNVRNGSTELMKIKANGDVDILNGVLNLHAGTGTGTQPIDAENASNTYIAFQPAGSNNDWAFLRQIGGNNEMNLALDFHDDDDDGGFVIRSIKSTSNPDVVITRFKVDRGGNVGIGTTTPQEKLDVNGTVLTSSVSISNYSTFGMIGHRDLNIYSATSGSYAILMHPAGTTYLNGYAASGTPLRFRANGMDRMYLRTDGNFGIGTSNPSEKLDVNGYCRAINFISTSDDRVKHNETPLTDSLGLISQLHPKRYLKTQQMYDASLNLTIDASGNYTDISENDVVTEEIGIIAQDVLSIDDLSFLVKPSLDPSGNETGPMGLDYQSLFVLSIQAIQELKARIETLEAQVL